MGISDTPDFADSRAVALHATLPRPADHQQFFSTHSNQTHKHNHLALAHTSPDRLSPTNPLQLNPRPRTTDTAEMVDTSEARIYDEIEIEDMTYDPITQLYTYPCPCGDRFEINIEDLRDGEEIAVCPSCSLMIRVIYEVEELPAAV
jgi:diphthamide biosynthesis protein 3